MNPNAKKTGTVVSGTWKNNMPVKVTVTTSKGTFNYEKKTHEMVRDSIGSMSSRASTVSDRSSIASVDSDYDFRDSVASMGSRGSNIVRGSWHAKKTAGGRRRKSRKSRKTRRRKRKN